MFSVSRRSPGRRRAPALEALEVRSLLSTTSPEITMISATTTDSRSVTFDYKISGTAVDAPITFTIDRSATDQAGPGAQQLARMVVNRAGSGSAAATLDQQGNPATGVGEHALTVPVAGGLQPEPALPYVVVTASTSPAAGSAGAASAAGAATPSDSTSFRIYTLGVITHGGVQPESWKAGGPPWEHQMVKALKADGYDAVIPFNWVAESHHPGAAAQQAPRLARMIEQSAREFPAGAVVDLHLIGHSEGTVINSLVVQRLNKQDAWTPGMKAGFLEMTMLDPHAANNGVRGQQYSVSNGLLGLFARGEINAFQSKAKDPAVVVPPNVMEAQVFYQHTPVRESGGTNHGIYNLWGQVPVHGQASYYNLTAPGMSHAGKFGVQIWYMVNVVPSLGTNAPFVQTDTLTAAEVSERAVPTPGGNRETVEYAGTAGPGATVHLLAASGGRSTLSHLGEATSGADGTWSLATRPLPAGRYRVTVEADAPVGPRGRPATMKPIDWPGRLVVPPG
jgi:hypothetical protein